MLRQISLIMRAELRNSIGLMLSKSSNAEGGRRILLIAIMPIFFAAMLIINAVSLSLSLASTGNSAAIPAYISTTSMFVVLFLALFRTAPKLYDLNSYERLSVMPFNSLAVVLSRLLSLYLLSLAVVACMSSGYIVYAVKVNPPFYFYIQAIVSVFLIPLLPLAIMEAVCALITAISSRMKRKNLLSVIISMLFILGIFAFTYIPMFTSNPENYNYYSNFSLLLRFNPTADWLVAGMVNGDYVWFIIFAVTSICCYLAVNVPISLFYGNICSALNSHSAGKKYNYTQQQAKSVFSALYRKELSFYLSSNGYMLNTGFGFILAVILAVLALVLGAKKIDSFANVQNLLGQYGGVVLSALFTLSPITASSISLEGKNWWIIRTLPIKSKTLFDAKIASALTITAPFYILCEIFLCIALRGDVMCMLRVLYIPLVYVVFFSVLGITINVRFPKFDYTNEMEVVKQSASVGLCTLVLMTCCVIPVLLSIFLKHIDLIFAIFCTVMLIVAAILYIYNSRISIDTIGEKYAASRIKSYGKVKPLR